MKRKPSKDVRVNVAVNCLIRRGKKFLLVKQARPETVRGKWALPGGKVAIGETFAAAASREVKEEVGLEAVSTRYLGCKHAYPRETIKHFFEVKVKPAKVRIPEEEILEAQWFTVDEIRAMKAKLRKPWVLDAIEEFLTLQRVFTTPREDRGF